MWKVELTMTRDLAENSQRTDLSCNSERHASLPLWHCEYESVLPSVLYAMANKGSSFSPPRDSLSSPTLRRKGAQWSKTTDDVTVRQLATANRLLRTSYVDDIEVRLVHFGC